MATREASVQKPMRRRATWSLAGRQDYLEGRRNAAER